MNDLTVRWIDGEEYVGVDNSLHNSKIFELTEGITGTPSVCGLCPRTGNSGANDCDCPHTLGNRQRGAKEPVTHPDLLWFPLKYWPILAMRIKGEGS